MSLDPLAERVARIALGLPQAQRLALAGGGAMLAHGIVDRPTRDIDLFTPGEAEVGVVADALVIELSAQGYRVTNTERRGTAYARLTVTADDGDQIDVELAVDARMRDTVELAVGSVLHLEELAADKTLALYGRGYARDLVDVDALTRRYEPTRLLELAKEKDDGFTSAHFVEALTAAAARPERHFTELGLTSDEAAELKDRAVRWARALRGEVGCGRRRTPR